MKRWLYVVQQRLAITNTEATALVAMTFLFLVGVIVGEIRRRLPVYMDETYAVSDRLFQEGARAAVGGFLVADADTTHSRDDSSSAVLTRVDEPEAAGPSVERAARRGLVDINVASATELQRLPRIGPALADRIVAYRTQFGPFRKTADLMNVRGIGPATYERLKAMLAPLESEEK